MDNRMRVAVLIICHLWAFQAGPSLALLTKHYKVTEEVVKEIKQTQQKIEDYMKPENIAKDSTKMKEMVLAAKGNDFDKVEEILKERKHLINGIPAERAWSALHQAVHHDNVKAVQMLFTFENCDVNIRAKRDLAGLTKAGDKPIKLATSQTIEGILNEKQSMLLYDVPTYVDESLGNMYLKKGIPLFLMSSAFLQKSFAQQIRTNYNDFFALTESFFDLIKENLDTVKSSMAESLYIFSEHLNHENQDDTRFDNFVTRIINIYTSNSVYAAVNMALRRSSEDLRPTGDDLHLCLYSFILETVLLNFNFPAYDGITYRGAELTADQISMYKVGTTFVWMSFTSSSESKESSFSRNVKFIFDNSSNSKWKPRDVSSYSDYPNETEKLYPAGAKFRVTSVRHALGWYTYQLDSNDHDALMKKIKNKTKSNCVHEINLKLME